MTHIIAVANQKGGVGKTTTTINLGACLANLGKKILIVDADAQGNATSGVGIQKAQVEKDIYDVLVNEDPITEAILPTKHKNLFIVPATIQLAGAEIELTSQMAREMRLKLGLHPVAEQYDYILIDCPPSLGQLSINAFTASDSILIPVQSEYYALEGLSQLIHTIDLVKDRLNKKLVMEGVVFTMYDARTNLSLQVVENVKDNLQQNIYKTIIPRNVRLAEAPSYGQPITLYDTKSAGAEAYRLLAEEVINREDE